MAGGVDTSAPFGTHRATAALLWLIGASDLSSAHPVSGWRRKVAKRYLRWTGRVYDVTYRALKLRLYPAENAGDFEITLHGRHSEEDEFIVFEGEVPKHRTFVDIGGNIGLYSLIAARLMPEGSTIIAFEPTPPTRAKFEQNLALNDLSDRVTIIPAGVGPEPAEMTMHAGNRHNAGQNSLNPGDKVSGAGVTVPIVTLKDTLQAQGVTSVGILKIDIEGFEDQALWPFFQTAPEALWPEYILLETCHQDRWSHDLLGALAERGYQPAFENPRNMHFRRVA